MSGVTMRQTAAGPMSTARPGSAPRPRSRRPTLPHLFADAEPATQRRIVQALCEQVEVLGRNEVSLHPSVEAESRGWAAAVTGEFRVEVRKTGRGERSHDEAIRVKVWVVDGGMLSTIRRSA